MSVRPLEYLVLDLLVGAVLALAAIRFGRRLQPAREHRFYAVGLIAAAFIYVVFSLRADAYLWLAVEGGGLVLFGSLAYLGLTRSAWFLVAGWLAHVVWDVGLHYGMNTPFVPAPYPGWCLSFDVVIAVYIAVRRKKWPRPGAAPTLLQPVSP